MLAAFRKLMGQSALYTLGNVIVRGAGYLLIPIYARLLTPAEYGLLGILMAVMNAASLILMFGLYAAAARLYFDSPAGAARRQLIGSLWCFLTIAPAAALVAFDRAGPIVFGGWLRQVPYDPYVRLALWSAYLANFSLLPTTMFRNQERPGRAVAFTAGGTVLSVVLALLFVVGFRQGVLGVIVAGLLANLIMVGVYSFALAPELELRGAWAKLWPALVYSLPFWPHAIAGWVLNLSDRILLERFVPLAQVGLYTLGYQMGQALTVVIEGGNQAWAPFFFRTESEQSQSPVVPRLATYFVTLMSGLCLAAALGARPALRLLTPPAYWGAELVAVWLALGFLSLAPYYVWANTIMHSKRVAGFPIMTLAAGLVNVGLNLWLIPRWGISAAAANTVIGYAVLAGLNYALARRVYPLPHEYGRWLKGIALAVLVGSLGQMARLENVWLEAAMRTTLVGVWGAALLMIGFLSESERAALARLRI